jgi:hypothetical protein
MSWVDTTFLRVTLMREVVGKTTACVRRGLERNTRSTYHIVSDSECMEVVSIVVKGSLVWNEKLRRYYSFSSSIGEGRAFLHGIMDSF